MHLILVCVTSVTNLLSGAWVTLVGQAIQMPGRRYVPILSARFCSEVKIVLKNATFKFYPVLFLYTLVFCLHVCLCKDVGFPWNRSYRQ